MDAPRGASERTIGPDPESHSNFPGRTCLLIDLHPRIISTGVSRLESSSSNLEWAGGRGPGAGTLAAGRLRLHPTECGPDSEGQFHGGGGPEGSIAWGWRRGRDRLHPAL